MATKRKKVVQKNADGTIKGITETEEDLPPPPGSEPQPDYYNEDDYESAADQLRAAYGSSDEGERIELSKYDPAVNDWAFLQNITPQEAINREAVKAIGKGDGRYKIEAFESGVSRFVKYLTIGIPVQPESNPLASLVNTAGKSDMGTIALIFGQIMQSQQEGARLAMESTKADLQYKMKSLEEDNKFRIEQMRNDREERQREQDRIDKAQERQMNLIIQTMKKDDPTQLLSPVLNFLGSTIEGLGNAMAKAGKPEPEGLVQTAIGALREFGPQLANLLSKGQHPASPGVGLPQPQQPQNPASFGGSAPNNGSGPVTVEPPTGNGGGSSNPPPGGEFMDLNIFKQQIESRALPMLYVLAQSAIMQEGESGPEWGPSEDHDPANVAGSLYLSYKQYYPAMSREQFGSQIRTVFGTITQFFSMYPKALETNVAWFRELYEELTMIVEAPIIPGEVHQTQ